MSCDNILSLLSGIQHLFEVLETLKIRISKGLVKFKSLQSHFSIGTLNVEETMYFELCIQEFAIRKLDVFF